MTRQLSSVSFLSLILVASVVFARRFAALGQRGLALYALAAGVSVLVDEAAGPLLVCNRHPAGGVAL